MTHNKLVFHSLEGGGPETRSGEPFYILDISCFYFPKEESNIHDGAFVVDIWGLARVHLNGLITL